MSADRLLTIKELAWELGRADSYVWAMRRHGFEMPGDRATLSEAIEYLRKNPNPWKGEYARRKKSTKHNAARTC